MSTPLVWRNLTSAKIRTGVAGGGVGVCVLLVFVQLGFYATCLEVATAPYALYLVLDLLASIATAARSGLRLLPVLPLVFPVIHVGLGWGYLKGWLTRRPATTEAR